MSRLEEAYTSTTGILAATCKTLSSAVFTGEATRHSDTLMGPLVPIKFRLAWE